MNPDQTTSRALHVLTFLAFCARRDAYGDWVLTLDEPHKDHAVAREFVMAVQAGYLEELTRRRNGRGR